MARFAGNVHGVVVQMTMNVSCGWPTTGKFHEHALADVILIFDFGFGQRGAAGNAPIHRLFAAINKALGHDVREQAQFVGLVFLVQREIRIFPIAKDAQPFELRALEINEFAGVGVAGFANGGGRRASR